MIKVLPVLLLLSACATSKQVYLPSGESGHSISCNGSANSISKCFEKAGNLCGTAGYSLLGREGEKIPFSSSNSQAFKYGTNSGAISQSRNGMFVNRSIMIQCNN